MYGATAAGYVCFFMFLTRMTSLGYSVEEDMHRSTSELISSRGYPVEGHSVITDDGYVLWMDRIPGATGSPPVLLMHGILEAGSDWVIDSPDHSFGYILHDQGYDVWIGNFRGNVYSRKHMTLSPESQDFWKFSWDEMGAYDLPAMMDYILAKTGQTRLFYVGYSLGTTAALAMLADKPQYNAKIRLFVALAPVAFAQNTTTAFRALAIIKGPLQVFYNTIHHGEVLANGSLIQRASLLFCRSRFTVPACMRYIFPLSGCTPDNLNQSRIPVYLSHAPAGTSVNTLLHYEQGLNELKFMKFDLGEEMNMKKYGQSVAPPYDLKLISAPVAMYWGESDRAADPTDVAVLRERLGESVVEFYKVPDPEWKHMDFLYGLSARDVLYPRVLQTLSKY